MFGILFVLPFSVGCFSYCKVFSKIKQHQQNVEFGTGFNTKTYLRLDQSWYYKLLEEMNGDSFLKT